MKILSLFLALGILAPSLAHAQSAPRGWEVEAAEVSQGVFDPGIHVFSSSSWIPGAEIRMRRDVSGDSAIRVAPEFGVALLGAGRSLDGNASSSLWMRRGSFGARVTVPVLAHGGLSAFGRAAVLGTWTTASVDDPYQHRSHDALAPGGLLAGGLTLDAGPLVSTGSRLLISAEAGHSASAPMTFGRWGHLDANGATFSGSVAVRF